MADNPKPNSNPPVLGDEVQTYNGVATTADPTTGQKPISQLVGLVIRTSDGVVVDVATANPIPTRPTTSGDVVGTLTSGRKTITTAGAAEAVVAASTPCRWVQVQALRGNTQDVAVGGALAKIDAGQEAGTLLGAGDAVTIPVDDAIKVFVDVLVNGEGVTYTIGV